MLHKCFTGQYLCRNFIISNNFKFHSIANGVFVFHKEKDNILEVFVNSTTNHGLNWEGCDFNNMKLRNIMSVLTNYSNKSKEANIRCSSITFKQFPENVRSQACTELVEVFFECNDELIKKMKYREVRMSENLMEDARELWHKGKIINSYNLFSHEYNQGDSQLQEEILKTLRLLIFYSIRKKGKAVVQDVVEGASIFSIKNQNFSPMVCVWFALFTSEMYEDWCLGEKVLTENIYITEHLEKYVPWLGYLFLMNNQLTNYQRLIETALKFNMNNPVGFLLRNLFAYYYRSGYYDGCLAVYNCCKSLDVKLTQDQEYKYTMLIKSSAPDIRKAKLEILTPTEVKYKF